MLCKDLFARQFSYQENVSVGELILQVVGYRKLLTLMKRQQLRLFLPPAVVPLITRLEEHQPNTILNKLAVYRVPMPSVYMNY